MARYIEAFIRRLSFYDYERDNTLAQEAPESAKLQDEINLQELKSKFNVDPSREREKYSRKVKRAEKDLYMLQSERSKSQVESQTGY